MVIVLALLTLALAAVLPFLYTSLNQATRTQKRLDAVEQARGALRLMTRELRQAAEILDQPGQNRGSDEDQVSFTVDLDGDGSLTSCSSAASPECFVYALVGGSLYRFPGEKKDPSGKEGALLASGVTALDIDYFGNDPACDDNGNGVVTEAEIDGRCGNANGKVDLGEFAKVTRLVVSLTVTQGTQAQSLKADITLRNRNTLVNPQ